MELYPYLVSPNKTIGQHQIHLYENLNSYSKTHPYLGRLLSIPIALVDSLLYAGRQIVSIIENLARAIFHLVGFAFSRNYSLKHAILHIQHTINGVRTLPTTILIIPIYFLLQTAIILIDPQRANSLYHADAYKTDVAK